jgi:glycosyltransferase involved in cell wall biosynthesis
VIIKHSLTSKTIKTIVLVGNYPPRKCGIATFTQDLLHNLRLLLPEVQFVVCALNESALDTHNYPPEVTLRIDQEVKSTYTQAAKSINEYGQETLVIVQHEYGIYGGKSGSYLINFLNALHCPIITTLHTLVQNPDEVMRQVTEQIIAASDRLVLQTASSFDLFNDLYPDGRQKTLKISHGIHPLLYKQPSEIKPRFALEGRSVLLTFGLLSRNKGIEYIISALPKIAKRRPDVIYLIVGATHPTVLRQEGESYRVELMKLIKSLSMQKHVRFVDDFLPVQDILGYLQATDVYFASSLDPQQAVSGTMSYALGAGRAVIATSFAQAKEVVSDKVGRIVPIGDSGAIADSAIELFSDPRLLESMGHRAFSQTRSMLWTNVADDYAMHAAEIAGAAELDLDRWPKINWSYLEALTDEFGLLQFAIGKRPSPDSGYTLDDNSRALQIVSYAYKAGLIDDQRYDTLSKKYLQVMDKCLSHSPIVNYLSATTRLATRQNLEEDLSDSMARAYYALQTARYCGSKVTRQAAEKLLPKIPITDDTPHIKSLAQILLGAAFALKSGDKSKRGLADKLSKSLIAAFHKSSTAKWQWFDTTMTYANGQLCASLLDTARATNSTSCRKIGLRSLEFLCKSSFMGDVYAPIGQSGWHTKDGERALFDQQPEDTFSMIQALDSAYQLTGDKLYVDRATKAFSWFMGNNLIGKRVYDDTSGGCHDGLTPSGVNKNEGAESTISYLGSRIIIDRLTAIN